MGGKKRGKKEERNFMANTILRWTKLIRFREIIFQKVAI